ncbi:MAG: DUF1294 domain-containing protein [Lachnospiraceae bacterium]|nr:DUF1294 domain-containing protein [Lachnospiraceae bacterium]MEE1255926.1 DUF1294 domain-containing protein [Lachnospiraceae bacterium]
MVVINIIAGYLAMLNLIGFALMGIDKKRAVKKLWRIPESTLFIIALIGGSIGSIIGMRVFHHKTRHWYFAYGMPAILFLQIAAVLILMYSPLQFTIM